MRTAVALAERHGHLGHRGLAIGVEQLGTVVDNGVILLTRTGEEARHVDERHDGDVESVAEAHEAGCLARCVAVEHAGIDAGLVGHDAHALAVEAGKAYDDVAGEVALHFEELSVVDDGSDDLVHVVGHVGVVGDDFVQRVFLAVDGVGAFLARGTLHVVLGDVFEQAADEGSKLFFRLGREVANATLGGVDASAAEFFLRDVLASHGLHHFRAREEHVAHAFEHDDEVGEGGRVDSAAGARTADARDLGHDAAGLNVALEDVAEAGQGVDALLDACAA